MLDAEGPGDSRDHLEEGRIGGTGTFGDVQSVDRRVEGSVLAVGDEPAAYVKVAVAFPDEFDAALDAFPGPIIATHTADWSASRLDESEVQG